MTKSLSLSVRLLCPSYDEMTILLITSRGQDRKKTEESHGRENLHTSIIKLQELTVRQDPVKSVIIRASQIVRNRLTLI